jgi:uroporphyrinogen decarboxylase
MDPPPVWIMRQAGRYLPEYRQLRTRAKDFLSFCYTPDLAVEAVLQPLRRFDLDAAILFSDILVVPDALGRKVWFVEGEGPRLEPLAGAAHWDFGDVEGVVPFLAPVYETVRRLRAELPADKALIGFAGAPWTIATYMIQGKGGDKDLARRTAYERPAEMDALLAVLVEATARHLQAQVEAGADCLQVFESWAEGLPEPLFERMILKPTTALMARLRATGVTALGVDTQTPAAFARAQAPPGMALQGALDPMLLVCGGAALEVGARQVIEAFRGSPHVFNLGHGITPQASPEHLGALVDLIKRG